MADKTILDFLTNDTPSVDRRIVFGNESTGELEETSIANFLSSIGLTGANYSPTFTGGTNVTGTPTGTGFKYVRILDFVIVSGRVDVNTTAGGSAVTDFEISLPVASNLANTYDLTGIVNGNIAGSVGVIQEGPSVQGETSNDTAQVEFSSLTSSNLLVDVIFMYEVK